MRHVTLLSWAMEAPLVTVAAWLRSVENSMASLCGSSPQLRRFPDGALLLCGADEDDVLGPQGGAVVLGRLMGETGTTSPSGALLSGRGPQGVMAPFAAFWRCDGSPVARAATDPYGLHHVYSYRDRHLAAVSSSASVLAELGRCSPDSESIGVFALTGTFMGDRSAYRAVAKVAPGTVCELEGGTLTQRSYVRPEQRRAPRRSDPVTQGLETLRCVAGELIPAGATLELSGGLDSRLLLAVLPRDLRSKLRSFTLGAPGSEDVRIARRLAELVGIEHTVVDLTGLGEIPPDLATSMVERSARTHEFGTNPLSSAVLRWVEDQAHRGTRVTGQNGEYARGFYYGGQRQHAEVTPALSRRLVRWRMSMNDAASRDLFVEGFLEAAEEVVVSHIHDLLSSYELDWLRATDELYLDHRMQHWLGAEWSGADLRRVVVAPFFHPGIIGWVRSLPPEDRRGSRTVARVLELADPDLSRIPLNGRRSVGVLAGRGVGAKLRGSIQTAGRVAGKVHQRVARRGKPGVGVEVLADAMQTAWARSPDLLEGLGRFDFLDRDVVDRLVEGDQRFDAASVGLLANLAVLGRRPLSAPLSATS